jgi:hypothetical protein
MITDNKIIDEIKNKKWGIVFSRSSGNSSHTVTRRVRFLCVHDKQQRDYEQRTREYDKLFFHKI